MHFGGAYEEEINAKAYDRALMGRFMGYLRPYKKLLGATLLILPFVALTRLAQPYLLKIAIDDHIVVGKMEGLPFIALLYLLLLLAESLFTFGEIYLLSVTGQKVMLDLRIELFSRIQRFSSRVFDRTPVGNLVTRITGDVEVLGEMFAAGIITVIGDILLLLGIVVVMLWMNWQLSLVTFSVLPLLFYVAFTFRIKMRKSFREVRSRLANMNGFLAESIGGMTVVQLFNRQKAEHQRFTELNQSYRASNFPVIAWDAALFALVEMLGSVAVALIIWYGGGEIVKGTLTFGALVAFIQYIERFFSPIRDLSAKYSIMQGAMAALERIFNLLDLKDVEEETTAGKSTGNAVQTIEFRNVRFAYDDEKVLKGLNLTIRQGEKIALVGETGGGKTTVTRLLSRLYDLKEGEITINGVDIRSLPLRELRRKIGMVLQEPYLFSGTIRYNICLGDPEAALRVEAAAKAVGADRFIEKLPGKYDEEIRERGSNLSAGERQLISFARAVAFAPEILVLDEATSSIDSGSERLVQKGLKALLTGRTSLVVAHRLSTIRDADRIVVIHKGEKAEEGSHQELMAKKGLYYRLYQLQFKD